MTSFRWKMRLADLVDHWDRVWAAEIRWRAHNREARLRGCPCGRPGTMVQLFDVTGSVPSESWRCDRHAGLLYGRPEEVWHDG
jgi:hypothetical protein